MNKLTLASLLLLHFVSQCVVPDKVDLRAEKALREKDFFRFPVNVKGKNAEVLSYFDLFPHRLLVGRALDPIDNMYDLRQIEVITCKAALKTLPPIKRYRGTLGFVAGMALTGIPYLYHRKAAHGTDKK